MRRRTYVSDSDSDEENEQSFMPTVQIIEEVRSSIPNLNIERFKLKLNFINPPQMENLTFNEYNTVLTGWLNRAFTTILQLAENRLNIRALDRVGFKFTNGQYDNFAVSFRPFNQYSSDVLLASISRVLQSNAEFL